MYVCKLTRSEGDIVNRIFGRIQILKFFYFNLFDYFFSMKEILVSNLKTNQESHKRLTTLLPIKSR